MGWRSWKGKFFGWRWEFPMQRGCSSNIPEKFGLERTLNPVQFHFPLSQVAPSPIQPGLEHFRVFSLALKSTSCFFIPEFSALLRHSFTSSSSRAYPAWINWSSHSLWELAKNPSDFLGFFGKFWLLGEGNSSSTSTALVPTNL